MRVYGIWIKRNAFYVQKHIAKRTVSYNFLLVRDKPLGAPAFVKIVYSVFLSPHCCTFSVAFLSISRCIFLTYYILMIWLFANSCVNHMMFVAAYVWLDKMYCAMCFACKTIMFYMIIKFFWIENWINFQKIKAQNKHQSDMLGWMLQNTFDDSVDLTRYPPIAPFINRV